jgi:hypothetical protein
MPRVEIGIMSLAPALRLLLVVLSFSMPGHAFGMAAIHAAQPPLAMAPAAPMHHAAPVEHQTGGAPAATDCLLTMCCACVETSSQSSAARHAEEIATELSAILTGALLFPSDPPPRFS